MRVCTSGGADGIFKIAGLEAEMKSVQQLGKNCSIFLAEIYVAFPS